ncbi:MAG: hypothetical protein AAB509_00185 [Patescibacteria group bacterium]
MNKKILFLAVFTAVLAIPTIVFGQVTAPQMVRTIRDAALTIAYSVVIIGWIIAGILWLVSAGSPERTGIAKKATFAAVIGTVVVILSNIAYDVIANLLNIPTEGI